MKFLPTAAAALFSVSSVAAQGWIPAYTYVVIGDPDRQDLPEGSSQCVAASELHELRCCSNDELPGYEQNEGCSVFAESVFISQQVGDANGCIDASTFQQGRDICHGDGARLCSAAEIESGCTAGSGCGHDADLVRSNSPCTPAATDSGGISAPTDYIPEYSWVVRGNPANAGIDGEVSPSCVSSDELHELRCCSDTELPGYQQKPFCGVWAESQFLSVGDGGDGCIDGADYSEAQSVCYADGARMCTKDEVTLGCTAGTGCNHDADLVRTSDPCTPIGVEPSTNLFFSHGYTWASKGNPARDGVAGEGSDQCVSRGDLHEVRCCSDVELPGYERRLAGDSLGIDNTGPFMQLDCQVWAESQFLSVGDGPAGCVEEATLNEAIDVCTNDGARLCTKAEMHSGCSAQTGCGHDEDLVRTSDPCIPEYAWLIVGSSGSIAREGGAACARTDGLNEVRCCSHNELPGYTQNEGCTVWAESQFLTQPAGCVDGADWEHAHQICSADGGRLCTKHEMQDQCTQGTGCGHDADLIWTRTACNPSEGFMGLGCRTADEFSHFTPLVNAQCCPAGECDTGIPTSCSSSCAEVLIPMLNACTATDPWDGANIAGYLSTPEMADLSSSLQSVAGLCGGGGH